MVQRFENFIRQNKLFNPDDAILLSVSGGIDSMVMTRLFERCGFTYAIAHCNFQLRGKESDGDALFVEKLSKKNKVEFHLENFDTKKYAEQHKISIQMAARQLRINWFENLMDQYGYSFYATAHHKDDQIETFLINLMRGTSISGLHGILPSQGRLIHPMLFTSRNEIEIFANKNKIPFREDSSNLQADYTRNKIRHQLLPVIKEINPEYTEIFTDNIERLRQVETIYFQQINSVATRLITKENDKIKISIHLLNALESVDTYLYEFLSPYEFNYSDVKRILDTLSKQSGKMFLSNSHRLWKDRDYLIIEKIKGLEPNEKYYEIQKDTREIMFPIKMEFNLVLKKIDIKFTNNKNQAFINIDKLIYPLLIRKWQKGDYFYPLGMKNKKLISDFFIDNKLSIPEKEKIWLLTSGEQVVWIIGHRIDNRFKVTSETQSVLRIQCNT